MNIYVYINVYIEGFSRNPAGPDNATSPLRSKRLSPAE